MTSRRWQVAMPAIAVAVLLAGCGAGSDTASNVGTGGSGSAADQGYVSGDGTITLLSPQDRVPAPVLTGTTLDGGTFTLSDSLGKVVVLNVWASWCAPCRAEAPDLARVARDLAGDGVQFAGLNIRDSLTTARAFVETFDVPYPNVIDRDGRLQLLFGATLPPQAIPSTVIIDRQGRVAGRALGKISESGLRGLIEPLLPR